MDVAREEATLASQEDPAAYNLTGNKGSQTTGQSVSEEFAAGIEWDFEDTEDVVKTPCSGLKNLVIPY